MKLLMFAINDTGTHHFLPPMFVRTEAEALRNCQSAMLNQDNQIAQFPEQFDLYELGSYCDQSGQIDKHESPQFRKKLMELKPQ